MAKAGTRIAILIISLAPILAPAALAEGREGRSEEGHGYSYAISPLSPKTGDLVRFELLVPGLAPAEARVAELRLDAGLSLESESLRSRAESGSSTRGTALRLELRVTGEGRLLIQGLVLEGLGWRFSTGPLLIKEGVLAGLAPFKAEAAKPVPVQSAPSRPASPVAAPLPSAPSPPSPRSPASRLDGETISRAYGLLRQAPPFSARRSEAKRVADAYALELGTGPALVDRLPPPNYFFFPAFFAALLALGLFLSLVIYTKVAEKPSIPRAIALVAVILALALAVLGLMSASERKGRYAVVWADSLRSIPSARAELSIPIEKGATASLRAIAGTYAFLVLSGGESEGLEGWAPLSALHFY